MWDIIYALMSFLKGSPKIAQQNLSQKPHLTVKLISCQTIIPANGPCDHPQTIPCCCQHVSAPQREACGPAALVSQQPETK